MLAAWRGCAGLRSSRSSSASRRSVRWSSWSPLEARPRARSAWTRVPRASAGVRAKRRILHKKRGNGSPIVDALDGLPQEGGDRKGPDPGAPGDGRLDRDRVRHEQGSRAATPRSARGPGPERHRVHGRRVRPPGALRRAGPPRPGPACPAVSMMSSRIRTSLPSTSPTTFRTSVSFFPVRRLSMMASEASEPLADGPGPGDAADVGRDDHEVLELELADRVEEHRRREEVIDRDVEEALDLRGVQVHRQDAVGARGRQQVRHELGRDRHARLVLLVLPARSRSTA